MRLKLSPGALVAALVEANATAPAAARQKGGDLVWLLADEGGARLRWGEWGRDSRPAGETAIPDVRVAEGGACPLLPTRSLRARLAKAFRGAGGTAEIRDGAIASGGVSERIAARGRMAEAAPPNGPPPRPGQVLRFDAGDFAAAAAAVTPFLGKEDYRPLLRRVEISLRRGVCQLAATDSYQLGVARLDLSYHNLETPFERTLPGEQAKVLGAVTRANPEAAAELRFGAADGALESECGATRLWVANDSGYSGAKFPNWRAFYGEDHPPLGARLFDPHSVAEEIRSYVAEYPEEKHLPVRLWLGSDGKVEANLHSGDPDEYERVEVGEAKVAVPHNAAFGMARIVSALKVAPRGVRSVKVSYEPSENGQEGRKPLYLESGFWRHLVMTYRV